MPYLNEKKLVLGMFAVVGIPLVSFVVYSIATGQGTDITTNPEGIIAFVVIVLIVGVALFFYGLSNMIRKKLMQSLPTSGGLLPRKNEQRKPFGCMIGRHSWIKDDLKAIKTCKFCDATKMMGDIITKTTREIPRHERESRCQLGNHSDPNPGVFGNYYCELCGTQVYVREGGGD